MEVKVENCKGCGKSFMPLELKDGFCEECSKAMGRSENYEYKFQISDILDMFTFEKDTETIEKTSETTEKDSENHESKLGLNKIDDLFTFEKDKVKISEELFEINGVVYKISDVISAEYISKRSFSWGLAISAWVLGIILMTSLVFYIPGMILCMIGGIFLVLYKGYLRVIMNSNELLLMKNVRKGYIQKVAKAINDAKKELIYKEETLK